VGEMMAQISTLLTTSGFMSQDMAWLSWFGTIYAAKAESLFFTVGNYHM